MLKLQYDKLQADSLSKVFATQAQLTANINAKESVAQVLSAGADAVVGTYLCSDGGATFSGRANVRLIINGEQGNIFSTSHNIDFTDKAQDVKLTPTSKLIFNVEVVDVDSQVTENMIKVNLTLNITAYCFVNNAMDIAIGGSDVQLKTAELDTYCLKAYLDTNFLVNNSVKTPQPISRILSCESYSYLNGYKIINQVLNLVGGIHTRIVYLSNGIIECFSTETDFAEEVAAEGFVEDAPVFVTLYVKSSKVRMDVMEEGDNNVANIEITLNVKASQMARETRRVATDAFSLTNDVALVINSIEHSQLNEAVFRSCKVDSSLDLEERFTIIGATHSNVNVVNSGVLNNIVTIEGTVNVCVLYKDEEGKVFSMLHELPFAQKIEASGIPDNSMLRICGVVTNIDFVKSNGKISIVATIMFSINSCSSYINSVVTDVKELEAKPTNHCAIEVCLAHSGDTLWDISKSLNIEESQIMLLNPELTVPLTKDEKIVLYHRN